MNKTCKIEDYKFQHKLNTRWKDLDAFRHINNAVFLSYIEDARIVLLKRWKMWIILFSIHMEDKKQK